MSQEEGIGGLVNMGLTCYANAVIQSLRHCPRIPWLLQEGRYNTLFKGASEAASGPTPKRQVQQEVTTAFSEVIQLLSKCKRGQSVRPAEFYKTVVKGVEDTLYEHFATKAPHDSHEFFLFILETIHESTSTEVEMRITRAPSAADPTEDLIQRALKAWQTEFAKQYSPFIDLFYGLSHWRTVCRVCKNTSHRWESFNTLKGVVPAAAGGATLPIAPTLLSMLQGDMEPEEIDGYQCDICKGKTTADRSMSLWRLPQIVVVVLKRNTANGRKIHTRLHPLEGGQFDFTPLFSKESPERAGILEYSVRAIVDHHGGATGGHYTAQCRDEATNKWYLFDDEGVMDLGQPHYGESTYMLFFERGSRGSSSGAPEAQVAKEA